MIEKIRRQLKRLAILDSILCPEWEYRYFSYNANWSETEEMGSLRDGCGGEWFFWSCKDLGAYKCLSPEDGLLENISEVLTRIPDSYEPFKNEPAFSIDSTSCIWYREGERWIKHGIDVKNLITLEQVMDWSLSDYQCWAEDYYEEEYDTSSMQRIFHKTFEDSDIMALNPEVDLDSLKTEWQEGGLRS
ncbi:hypothetical protein MRY87_10840 [bacterium]|nr:hypothetical protein [bacterium]